MEPMSEMKNGIRNSKMILNEVYFWTDTIKDWKLLLDQDKFKNIIVDSPTPLPVSPQAEPCTSIISIYVFNVSQIK